MVQAVRYFDQAQQHYLRHEWRHTVESLRQSLAEMVGKQPDDEEQDVRVLETELRRCGIGRLKSRSAAGSATNQFERL